MMWLWIAVGLVVGAAVAAVALIVYFVVSFWGVGP